LPPIATRAAQKMPAPDKFIALPPPQRPTQEAYLQGFLFFAKSFFTLWRNNFSKELVSRFFMLLLHTNS
jgi:hypothetical protein